MKILCECASFTLCLVFSPGDAGKAEQQRLGVCSQGAEEGHHFAG